MKNTILNALCVQEMNTHEMRQQNGGTFKGNVAINTAAFIKSIYNWVASKFS